MTHKELLVLYAEAIGELAATKAILNVVIKERDHYKRMVDNQRVNAVNEILARADSDVLQ